MCFCLRIILEGMVNRTNLSIIFPTNDCYVRASKGEIETVELEFVGSSVASQSVN